MLPLLSLLALMSAHTAGVPSQLDLLRERTVMPLLPTSATIQQAATTTRSALDMLQSNGSWPDINYSDISQSGRDHWQPQTHISRLQTMSSTLVACNIPDNHFCNNSILRTGVQTALTFWLQRNPCSENWYFNQISAPESLSAVLLLLQHGGFLAFGTLMDADVLIQRGADWWQGWSGYNLVSLAKLNIYRGLLYSNESLVTEGFDAVWSQLSIMPWPAQPPSDTKAARCNSSSVATVPCIANSCQIGGGSYLGDGIQIDGSFHQHGAQLLDGAYGQGLTEAISTFLPIGAGLKWSCPLSNLEVFGTLVLGGQRKMSLQGPSSSLVWDWLVCGRGCSISGSTANVGIDPNGLRFAAGLFPQESPTKSRLLQFADELEYNYTASIDADLHGSFAYFRSDYVIHRRANWSASWKGRSNRTIPARCVNGDSKMSAETGEGSTFIYRADEKGMAHVGVWPVIDWQQYPGVTTEQGELQPCAWQYEYASYPTFVGSVSDGNISGAAQVLGSHTLSARRSWLFSESVVATVLSDVSVGDSGSVFTTIANQRLSGDVTLMMMNGTILQVPEGNNTFDASTLKWIEHNYTTYVISDGLKALNVTAHIECGERVGDYWRISMTHKPAFAKIFRLSLEHGTLNSTSMSEMRKPLSEVGVAIYPNTKPNPVKEMWTPLLVKALTNINSHVLTDQSFASSVTSITFWESDNVTVPDLAKGTDTLFEIRSDSPSIVLIQELSSMDVVIAVSNPDEPGIIVQIDIKFNARSIKSVSDGCKLSSVTNDPSHFQTITFTLPSGQYLGKSVVCTLSLAV